MSTKSFTVQEAPSWSYWGETVSRHKLWCSSCPRLSSALQSHGAEQKRSFFHFPSFWGHRRWSQALESSLSTVMGQMMVRTSSPVYLCHVHPSNPVAMYGSWDEVMWPGHFPNLQSRSTPSSLPSQRLSLSWGSSSKTRFCFLFCFCLRHIFSLIFGIQI